MKRMMLFTSVLVLAAAPACVVDAEGERPQPLASEDGDGGGHGGDCHPSPVMISGDFDGDGTVTTADIAELEARIDAGDYAAYYDMNADGMLSGRDVSRVALHLGEASHPRDLQVAQAWADVQQWMSVDGAVQAGFIPFTQELKGHGLHYANFNRIYRWQQPGAGFEPGLPEGINYDGDGNAVAVFYYAPGAVDLADYDPTLPPRSVIMEIPAVEGFVGHHDHWHHHIGACFGGLGTLDPDALDFDQCVPGSECPGDVLWSAQFHMVHLWLLDYNPCGAFAGTNPNVSVDADPEPHHMACDIEEVVDVVLPYGSFP